MNHNLVLIGADPEAFVRQGNKIHHCIGMLGGSKNDPRLVYEGAVQEDNVLFEFNIDATDSRVTFSERIQSVLSQGAEILGETGLCLVPGVSSHVYDTMTGFPEKAFEFGCTPDYNGLTGEVNPRPTAVNQLLRTAGGHVHIGWSHLGEVTPELQRRVIIACDYVLGLPSLLEDNDTRRRELYGKAGACRYKKYGVEYRTLSNYWIWDMDRSAIIHQRAQKAVALALSNQLDVLMQVVTPEECQSCINSGDAAAGRVFSAVVDKIVEKAV